MSNQPVTDPPDRGARLLERHPVLARILPDLPARPVSPTRLAGAQVQDAFRGALVGTAIGDVLGGPLVGVDGPLADTERHRFVALPAAPHRPVDPTTGREPDGVGHDTALMLCVATSLVSTQGRLSPENLAGRLVTWMPQRTGPVNSCTAGSRALADGVAWWESGVPSAGNGAALRAAPVGLAHRNDLAALCHDAVLSAWLTHVSPTAVVAAVAHAWLVARLVDTAPGSLDPSGLVEELCETLAGLGDPGEPDRTWRTGGRPGGPVPLVRRLGELPATLGWDRHRAAAHFGAGAFVLESLPMALWYFLHDPDDAHRALTDAALGGGDADSIASMTGAYLGAYLGESALPEAWRGPDLPAGTRIRCVADLLFEVSSGA